MAHKPRRYVLIHFMLIIYFCMGWLLCSWPEAQEMDYEDNVTVVETDLETGEVSRFTPDLEPAAGLLGPKVEVKFITDRNALPETKSSLPSLLEPSLPVQETAHESSQSSQDIDAGVQDPEEGWDVQELDNKMIIQLNASLKEMIERNSELIERNQELDRDLKSYVGQKRIDSNRITSMSVERDAYKKQAERILTIKERLEDNIAQYKTRQRQKEEDLQAQIVGLRAKIERQEKALALGTPLSLDGEREDKRLVSSESSLDTHQKTLKVLTMLNEFSEKTQQAQKDEGKIHYNMGNIFFHQGQYARAAKEYREAVVLMPDDYNAHFNLAFVSSEFMLDPKTALKHYKMYLQLNTGADDAALVKEKILAAELDLSSKTDSSLEGDLLDYRRQMYQNNFGGLNE